MAVVDVKPKIRSQGGNAATDASTQAWARTMEYSATVDDGSMTLGQVLADPRIPGLRSPHPDGTYLLAVRQRGDRVGPMIWDIQIDYATPQGSGGGGETSPLLRPAIITFDAEMDSEAIDEDIHGQPLLTVLGEEWNPRITELLQTPIIVIQKNVNWVSPSVIAQYRNTVNSDVWYGNPIGTCCIRAIRAQQVNDDTFSYWTVDARIAVRRGAPRTTDAKAWWRRVLAQGYIANRFVGPAGMVPRYHFANPVLHDKETGNEILSNASAQFYEFETKVSLPYGTLGLYP